MAKTIVGREREQQLFSAILASKTAELVALYGRRRVGKTFLVREFMGRRAGLFFEVTGLKDGSAAIQRQHFHEALEQAMLIPKGLSMSLTWNEALTLLTEQVRQRAALRPKEPIVLFFDELPWLATPKSGLLEAIDYFWNRHLSQIPQVKLVLCGSAASWMLRRIVHAKGGLHNRITQRVRLDPLTIRETDAYLAARKVRFKPIELLELYMALGGVPYYLNLVPRGRSVAQVLGALCFEHSAPLQDEFRNVLASLFNDPDQHVAVLRALIRNKEGMSREELLEALGRTSGGSLNRLLQELEEAGFIARVEPYGRKVKSSLFRVIDQFTLFHWKWITAAAKGILARGGAQHWSAISQTAGYRSWTGYAFESLCLTHAKELQIALGIENLVVSLGSWRHVARPHAAAQQGAQIDLLFDRRDGVINLCELKFSTEPFTVTKSYAQELQAKLLIFEQQTKTRKRVIITLVAPLGLKPNIWSSDLIEQVVDAKAFL